MNNKKVSTIILSILLVAGSPLLMANSPAPFSRPDTYTDFTNTSYVLLDEDNEYKTYETSITNTGIGYISLDYYYFINNNDSKDTKYASTTINYYDEVIAPNQTKTISFKIEKEINLDNYSLSLEAYLDFADDDIYEISAPYSLNKSADVTYDSNDNPRYTYTYSYSVNINQVKDPGDAYSEIVTLSFDGEIRSYFCSYISSTVYITTNENFNINTMEVVSYKFLNGNKRSGIGNGFFEGLSIALVIILLSPFILGFSVALVFLIISIIKKSKRKKYAK